MYRCEVCDKPSPPRATLLRHVMRGNWVQQANGRVTDEISREVRCCRRCLSDLEAGGDLTRLQRQRRAAEALPAPVVTPEYVPPAPPAPLPDPTPLLTLGEGVSGKKKRVS